MEFLNTSNKTRPVASVIIPAYNAHKTLSLCLDSVLSQTCEDIEVIVTDDGSVDSTYALALEYSKRDSRVKVLQRENGGISAARNTALEVCTGESITPDCIEKSVARARETGADIVLCGITYVSNFDAVEVTFSGKGIDADRITDWNTFFDIQATCGLVGYSCNKLYKKSFFDFHRLRFNEKKKYQEDLDFIIRAFSKTNKMYLLDESFYLYRFEEKVAKISGSFDVIDNYLMLFDRLFSIGDNPDNRTEQIYHTVTGILYNTLFWCEGYDEIVPFLNKLFH